MDDTQMTEKIQELIDNNINPAVAAHGGVITLLEVKDKKVYLRMGGGCHGCGMAAATLKQGVEKLIKEMIPEVQEIIDATEHSGGQNPYFKPE